MTTQGTPSGSPTSPAPHSGRGALLGLAALFFVPLLGAFWLYYAGGPPLGGVTAAAMGRNGGDGRTVARQMDAALHR
jgi:hypothetical protein